MKKIGINLDLFLNKYSDDLNRDDTGHLAKYNTTIQLIKLEYQYIQLAEKYEKPDIALYLNSDYAEENYDAWEQRIHNLIDLNVPTIITFDNKKKYEQQKSIIFGTFSAQPYDLGLEAEDTVSGVNPFKELFTKPNVNAVNNVEEFTTSNAYILAFQGYAWKWKPADQGSLNSLK